MSYVMRRRANRQLWQRNPRPTWLVCIAIGQFVIVLLGGVALIVGIASGYVPLGTYASRIVEQGNILGYACLYIAPVLVSAYLMGYIMAAGLGIRVEEREEPRRRAASSRMADGSGLPLAYQRSASALGRYAVRARRSIGWARTYARLLVVVSACLVVGAVLEANVCRDLLSGPATVRGIVSDAHSEQHDEEDSHGNPYTVTTYYVTIDGRQFSSSVAALAGVFTRATVGQCAVASYGRYTSALVDLTPCAAR